VRAGDGPRLLLNGDERGTEGVLAGDVNPSNERLLHATIHCECLLISTAQCKR
jgi:hypothetical protein